MFYRVGPHVFSSLSRLKESVQLVLWRATPEQKIEGREAEFILGLLDRHPNAKRKIGCGVADLFVRINWKTEHYEDRCFWIRRTDGSETDFSYRECITPTDHRGKFIHVCRVEIHDYIQSFREKERRQRGDFAICPLTGKQFEIAKAHVDHQYPDTFESLVEQFISEHNIVLSEVEIIPGRDAQLRDRFADENLARSWREFHRARAVLRLLPSHINQRLGNGKPR